MSGQIICKCPPTLRAKAQLPGAMAAMLKDLGTECFTPEGVGRLPGLHVGPADTLGARTVRLQEINPRNSPNSPGVANLKQVSESPSFSLCRSGGAGPRLCLSYTLSDMTLGPQADGVTRKPVPPLLPDSGCRAGGLASKESTTVPAGFMEGCSEAHHWFLHVLPLWMLSMPTKPMAVYH